MRKYEHLTDEKLSESLKHIQFQPDLLWEVENEQRNRAIERSEIEKKTNEELIDFILLREEEIGGIYSFQLKYAIEQAKQRGIGLDEILIEKEQNQFYERLFLEVSNINKDIGRGGRYKTIRDFIQMLRIFNGIILFFSSIGAVFICFSKPIMLIGSLVGIIGWYLILKAVGVGLELLSDIERNGRIHLFLSLSDKSKPKNTEK